MSYVLCSPVIKATVEHSTQFTSQVANKQAYYVATTHTGLLSEPVAKWVGRGARSRLVVTKLTHLNFCILHLQSSRIEISYLTKFVYTNRLIRIETCIYNVLL